MARCYSQELGWERGGGQPWKFLYDYGVVPAWVVSISALAVLGASYRARSLRHHRRAALFLVLVMIVGPGLIVNNVFKQNWGRPRPHDVVTLGGDRAYVAPWVKRPAANGNSFASGHAATGFYLLVPYFLLRRRSPWWAAVFATLGIGYGAFVGYARMLQGAHFASDILWSLGFVYIVALALLYLLRIDGPGKRPVNDSG